jgi:hypothetical protein
MEGADWLPGQQRQIVRYPAGQVQGHVAVAFTNASMVPPGNIRTTINSRGTKDTTIMVP